MQVKNRVGEIVKEVQKLIKVCYPDYDFKVSYLTIFSQSDEDFDVLRENLQKLGQQSEANNGYKYRLNRPVDYLGEHIDLVRTRKPDVHRKELGCADLVYSERDYGKLREIALEKGFDVILRKGYEMVELSDLEINVYAYLVKDF